MAVAVVVENGCIIIRKRLRRRGVHVQVPAERTVHWLEDGFGEQKMEGSFGAGIVKISSCSRMVSVKNREIAVLVWDGK